MGIVVPAWRLAPARNGRRCNAGEGRGGTPSSPPVRIRQESFPGWDCGMDGSSHHEMFFFFSFPSRLCHLVGGVLFWFVGLILLFPFGVCPTGRPRSLLLFSRILPVGRFGAPRASGGFVTLVRFGQTPSGGRPDPTCPCATTRATGAWRMYQYHQPMSYRVQPERGHVLPCCFFRVISPQLTL